jgi:hypothetical protein
MHLLAAKEDLVYLGSSLPLGSLVSLLCNRRSAVTKKFISVPEILTSTISVVLSHSSLDTNTVGSQVLSIGYVRDDDE